MKKVSGTAIGNDFATLANADGTYDSEGMINLEAIPRASAAVAAGGNFAWNAVADTANKLTLNITEEGV